MESYGSPTGFNMYRRKTARRWLGERPVAGVRSSRARSSGRERLRPHVDKKAAAHLSTPRLLSTSGYTQSESKKAIRTAA
ncbi:hypothetical protein [Streptomyces sp. NPDC007063]|uniref:hypothetical protein n=1 Tax=Streptomyces sp. NPDC007063 TaxID=3364772 RepID=UPI0036AA570F